VHIFYIFAYILYILCICILCKYAKKNMYGVFDSLFIDVNFGVIGVEIS